MWTFIFISFSRICTSCCMEGRWPDSSLDQTGTSVNERKGDELSSQVSYTKCTRKNTGQPILYSYHSARFRMLLLTSSDSQSYCWRRTPSCRHISIEKCRKRMQSQNKNSVTVTTAKMTEWTNIFLNHTETHLPVSTKPWFPNRTIHLAINLNSNKLVQ